MFVEHPLCADLWWAPRGPEQPSLEQEPEATLTILPHPSPCIKVTYNVILLDPGLSIMQVEMCLPCSSLKARTFKALMQPSNISYMNG